MSVYDNARALAEELLESELGKKYTEAKYIFENNADAVEKLKAYNDFRESKMRAMKADRLSATEIDEAKEQITAMANELRANKVINEMVLAENKFNYFVQNVMNVFNATLTGNMSENGGCTGSCGSCGGCH
jgi:cell fate (sporulation/competence/biofilm development) regulator YlbF (YheA/YmcA/DUF963 family)